MNVEESSLNLNNLKEGCFPWTVCYFENQIYLKLWKAFDISEIQLTKYYSIVCHVINNFLKCLFKLNVIGDDIQY